MSSGGIALRPLSDTAAVAVAAVAVAVAAVVAVAAGCVFLSLTLRVNLLVILARRDSLFVLARLSPSAAEGRGRLEADISIGAANSNCTYTAAGGPLLSRHFDHVGEGVEYSTKQQTRLR